MGVCKLSSLLKKNIFLTLCTYLSAYIRVVSFSVAACECTAAVWLYVYVIHEALILPYVPLPPCERFSPTLRIFVSEMKVLDRG